uniref:Uncharacterized protein n=1 Tax=Timema monikensis TaxID=170555 RepID=A0A7R9EKH0_9NEOP|nr:unnamed protein product [Timema monikensis]
MDMVIESVQLLPEKSRKKRRDRSNWTKEKIKQKRSLTMQDVRRFHQRFYSTSDKVAQDNFILKYTIQEKPKRNRFKNGKKKPQDVNQTRPYLDS